MTATAANARLLGCTEGPSDAWRTALALRADAQQSRPSAQSLQFCRVFTRPRRGRVLLAGVSTPHAAVQMWRALSIVWLVRPLGRGWHAQFTTE